MALIINGTTVPYGGAVNYNGTELDKIICNGSIVWERKATVDISVNRFAAEVGAYTILYCYNADTNEKLLEHKISTVANVSVTVPIGARIKVRFFQSTYQSNSPGFLYAISAADISITKQTDTSQIVLNRTNMECISEQNYGRYSDTSGLMFEYTSERIDKDGLSILIKQAGFYKAYMKEITTSGHVNTFSIYHKMSNSNSASTISSTGIYLFDKDAELNFTGTCNSSDYYLKCPLGYFKSGSFYNYTDVKKISSIYFSISDFQYSDLSAQGSGWTIGIINNNYVSIYTQYNNLMCNSGDAMNWTGLSNISGVSIAARSRQNVTIKGNWFADYITTSYVEGSKRRITYANNISNTSLSQGYNTV